MKKIWIIVRLTFYEVIKRRIVLVSFVLGIIFLVVFGFGFNYIYKQMMTNSGSINLNDVTVTINFFLNSGLYAVTFLSVALGALLGADTLSSEITSGTIQTIASKPIRRSEIVLGKWLSHTILLATYSVLMTGGVIVIVWLQSWYIPNNILFSQILIYLESVLIMTIAMMYSSFLPSLATGAVVFGLYGLAFIGGWIEQIGALLEIKESINIGIIVSLIIPSESLWRRASFEMQSPFSLLMETPFSVISVPSDLMIWYAVFYMLVTVFLTIKIFEQRDL